MVIYTRTGDKGTTATLGGERHSKDHVIFEANGTVDELSAQLGLLRARWQSVHPDLAGYLLRVQEDLVLLGAYISSGEPGHLGRLALTVEGFEAVIDQVLGQRPVQEFVIPGANELEAGFHLSRTVCRRAERRLAALLKVRPDVRMPRYVNRLSDLLFAFALWAKEPFDLSL
jgi:cob(I)alamin adenosyltransferase